MFSDSCGYIFTPPEIIMNALRSVRYKKLSLSRYPTSPRVVQPRPSGSRELLVFSGSIDGVDMLYSSGTTGRPKGIKLGLAMTPVGTPTSLSTLCSMLFGIDKDSIYLSPAPLYHAAPLRFTMTTHRLGGTAIIMEHFDPEEYLRLVAKHKVTHSQLVPTMFVRMLKLDKITRTKYKTSSLKCAIHAAAPCPVEVKRQM
ncbi:MAG: hypothetical protein EBY08_05645, partial [Actinobacteria bacterium]|nr:hypothetical protein [Actinomycetota bacterium]